MTKTIVFELLALTMPIFIIISLGFFAVKSKVLTGEGVKVFGVFLIYFAVPALLFNAMSSRSLGEIIQVDYLLVYALGSLFAFFFVFVLAKVLRGQNISSAAIYGMGGSFANTIMIGYPIASAILGSVVLVPFALILLVEILLVMPLTLILADLGARKGEGKKLSQVIISIFLTIIKNPIIIGIAFGILFSIFSIEVPAMIVTGIDLLAKTVTGLGLFAVGGMLAQCKYEDKIPDISIILLGKLLIHPVAVLVLFMLIGDVDPLMQIAAVIIAGAPTFGIYAIIGQQYNMGELCAAAIVPITISSFISLNVIIWLLNDFFHFL